MTYLIWEAGTDESMSDGIDERVEVVILLVFSMNDSRRRRVNSNYLFTRLFQNRENCQLLEECRSNNILNYLYYDYFKLKL